MTRSELSTQPNSFVHEWVDYPHLTALSDFICLLLVWNYFEATNQRYNLNLVIKQIKYSVTIYSILTLRFITRRCTYTQCVIKWYRQQRVAKKPDKT